MNPRVPLSYTVQHGADSTFNDEACVVDDHGILTMQGRPTLAARCLVEVAAAEPLPAGFLRPEPVSGFVEIGFMSWDVHVRSPGPVSWSGLPDGVLAVAVDENSGDAFSISIGTDDDPDGNCSFIGIDPPGASPPGTTRYTASIRLKEPVGADYTCVLRAEGEPQDYAGGNSSDTFTIVVTP